MRKADATEIPLDVVIRNGTLVTASDTFPADVGIRNGKIVILGQDLQGSNIIDATDLLVIPGGVDPHVHLEMPVGDTQSSDDWLTGTIAAACGGTTTVLDFVEPGEDGDLIRALQARRELAQSKAVIDFGLHMTLVNDSSFTLSHIPGVVSEGCTSFKIYTTYDGFRLADKEILAVLGAVQAAGGMVMVHAENDAIIEYKRSQFRREQKTAPRFHRLSRPGIAEQEAVQRMLAFAEVTGCPLYIVHVSKSGAALLIAEARSGGINVLSETCPQYLLLTGKELERPGLEGAKFICSPPLRTPEDNAGLWKSLSVGNLQTVGTDHCPFFFEGQKNRPGVSYEKIPAGLPGIELRLALTHTYGVGTGKLTLNQWVQGCSTNPAKAFGLYPRKGSLAPGADADIVLFDPRKKVKVAQSLLHEQVDYTPYEGFELQGYPVTTISHGKIIADHGQFTGTRGSGHYLARKTHA